jgi:hypothetical protein
MHCFRTISYTTVVLHVHGYKSNHGTAADFDEHVHNQSSIFYAQQRLCVLLDPCLAMHC